ncbi:FecR family protein [Mucilaginibacter paludis]|nr:FecR family protein [Mucilaginibacter paludis]
MTHKDITELLEKYRNGTATEEEIDVLLYRIQNLNKDSKLTFSELEYKSYQARISENLPVTHGRIRPLKTWLGMAAAVLIFAGLGTWFYLSGQHHQVSSKISRNELLPGGNQAILTLDNGKQVILNGTHAGTIASQGNVVVSQTANGAIAYLPGSSSGNQDQEIRYNQIATYKGGEYQITLADGTKVWINAASALKYPTRFTGNYRTVELTGEAYFEVAKNKHLPFKVLSKGQVVEVLGTHFNINTYGDDGLIKTTLLEGSVKISAPGKTALLKPGQQARLDTLPQKTGGHIKVVENIDTEDVVAWKSGAFVFDNSHIQQIMLQIARCYNANINYEGIKPQLTFTGVIKKSSDINDVLELIERAGDAQFKVNGKTITVKKK